MKNNFQSKAVPRGTRTIWRYLGALILFFALSIGQMWGTDYLLINDNDDASTATLNNVDFWTTQALQEKSNGGDDKKCIITAGTISKGITNVKDPSRYIQYDMKTTATSFVIKVYNTNSSDLKINIYDVIEAANGTLTTTVKEETAKTKQITTISYTPETEHPVGTKATFYVAVPSSNSKIEFYQITATETGSPLTDLKGGRVGYSVDFNKKSRLAACSGKISRLDSVFYSVGGDYIPTSKTEIQLKSGNYVQFKTIEPIKLTVVTTSDKEFCVATEVDGTTNSTSASGTHIYKLRTADEWYIVGKNSSATKITNIAFDPLYTITYLANGGGGSMNATNDTVGYQDETIAVPVCKFTAPSGYEFDKWAVTGVGGTTELADEGSFTMPNNAVTLTAQWKVVATKYTIAYSKGTYGTGDAIPDGKKDQGVDFTLSSATYSRDGYVQTGWATEDGGAKAYDLGGTYSTDADEELFPFWTPVYTVTKGSHANGDFTISPASLVAGGTVTLDPTPNDGYMFSAWEIEKTSDASATGITVTNKQFTMPAYGVTVNATFVADTRKKVLYVTKNSEATTKSDDKLYAALKDDYNITIVGAAAEVTYTNYDLVVLHESVDGSNHNATAVGAAKTTSVPVLNTKSYFYTSGSSARWGWGTPDAGTSVKGATQNSAYCNIADHPIFAGVTVTDGFVEITDDAAAKCMQPIKTFVTGYEGYTLATTPNSGSGTGNGCAIHEIPAGTEARGASSGKYLMISVSSGKLGALNANGQKLFQNAAAYLTGSTSWTPVEGLINAEIAAPGNPFTEGDVLTLTASATGSTAATTYAWYKGATWAEAEAEGAIQAAKTAENNGHIYTKTSATEDAGKYWCVMVKSTGCEVTASIEVSVLTCTKPGTPANLEASNEAYTTADLAWDAADNADGYKVSIIKKSDESVVLDWTDCATNSYAATGLTQGTTYTFKVKAKGATGYCEYGLEATLDFATTVPSVADLVTIADDYAFAPSATIAAGTLAEDNKFFAAGPDACDYGSGLRVKENRPLAFKVNNGAKVKVTFTTNGDREMQLGTAASDDDNKAYGHTKTSPATFDVTADGVVYLTASSDLRFSKLEIMYPHTVTYDLNGGTGTTPTQASKYVGETFTAHDGEDGITAPETKEFDKWVDQDEAEVAGGATYTMPAKNVTLTAQWKAETVKYTVTYDLADYTAGVAPTETNKSEGAIFSIKAAPEREGYDFLGWKCNIDEATYQANDSYTMTAAATTFTAQWKQFFIITYKDGDATLGTEKVYVGDTPEGFSAPTKMGYSFDGWKNSSDEDVDPAAVTETITLFVKWTEFAGCTELWPATSGDAPTAADQEIVLQTGSAGGHIYTVSAKDNKFNESFNYTTSGLALLKGSADVIRVELANDIAVDTKISVTLVALGTGARGLNLLNANGGKVKGGTTLGWADATNGAEATFSYTVEAEDGLEGTNVFRLQRNNSVALKCVRVESCGDAIIYHNLTSTVNIAGKGTVTLGAGTVREGYTTTATYSDIDPLYEFVSWSVSGAGASVESATANPATITVGTEDAVVTLNLQLIPVKFTVNYYDGETLMGSELVAVNENPTASEINTNKRHFTFQGWAETDGGSVVALNTITSDVAATISLYAVYAPVACPSSGTIFSMVPKLNELASDYQLSGTEEVTIESLGDYATVSGGELYLNNNNSSNRLRILKETSAISFVGGDNGYIHVLLDCQLKENDIIRFENSERLIIANNASKTGSVNIAKTVHQFVVPAAWEDKDEFYIWRDGTGMNISSLEVYRPALFTVSFDVLGHGSAPADLTDVLEGSMITAPTAPTDEDYAFVAWYKENTLDNEWDFNNDVVSENTTLYAKWLDKSDATLKSLKYGTTDIELEDGIYEYEIALPAATASVPALTAVTNNPAATAVVTDDDAFDGDGKATSTVEVTPQKEGAAHLTYTVNFTKLAELPQVDVTVSTLWDFSLGGSTTLQNQTDVVLANLPGITNDATFNSQALKGTFNKLPGNYFQGSKLMFNVAEDGLLTIEFSGTNNNARHLQVCVGDGETVIADWDYNNGTHQTKSIEIPAGKITLKAFEGEGAQNVRIYNLEYLTLAHRRTAGYNVGDFGTVCLEDATIIDGATLYELAGLNEYGYLAFDEVTSGALDAGKPYLFEVTNPSKISFYKPVGAAHADDEIATNGMIGTFTGTTLYQGAENYYYFSGRHIWKVNDFTVAIPIPANRCYVDMDVLQATPAQAPAAGRRRVMMGVNGKQTPTSIDAINAGEAPVKMVINGQLFILRGEKMYDATGRLVK